MRIFFSPVEQIEAIHQAPHTKDSFVGEEDSPMKVRYGVVFIQDPLTEFNAPVLVVFR